MRRVRCGDNPALYRYSAALANASGISMGVLLGGAHGLVCESRGTLSDSNAGIAAVTSTERAALVGEQQQVAGFIRRFADIMYAAMVGNASVSSIGVRGGRGHIRVGADACVYYCMPNCIIVSFPRARKSALIVRLSLALCV